MQRTWERTRSAANVPVQTTVLDALDEAAVDLHAQEVADAAGHIDVVFNVVSFPLIQGTPLLSMTLGDVLAPLEWVRTQYLTSRAAGRLMVARGSGTILTLSASPARIAIGGVGGFAAACSAVGGLTRTLAAELGPRVPLDEQEPADP